MNEKIKELVNQAGMTLKPRRPFDDNKLDGYWESDNDFFDNNLQATRVFFDGGLEKFAELIIKECAGVELYWLSEQDRKSVAEKLKEHFGVE